MVKVKEFSQDLRDVVAKHFEMKKPTVEIIKCMAGQAISFKNQLDYLKEACMKRVNVIKV